MSYKSCYCGGWSKEYQNLIVTANSRVNRRVFEEEVLYFAKDNFWWMPLGHT